MRITLVRDDGKVNTMRTLRIEQLVEQMKVETKAQSVSKMREVLPFMLPGDKNAESAEGDTCSGLFPQRRNNDHE